MRRFGFSMPVAFFVLAMCGSATAQETKADGANVGLMAPATRVECSFPKPGEPLDPPATSAVQPGGQFVARQHFKEDTAPSADVQISWLGATFVRRFATKTESAGAALLQAHSLRSSANDRNIIAELGGGHETRLADVWCLLKQQARGEDGALQTNAVPNIFLVRDSAGELGVVDTIWSGAGWEIGASPVGDRRMWFPGTRIISR